MAWFIGNVFDHAFRFDQCRNYLASVLFYRTECSVPVWSGRMTRGRTRRQTETSSSVRGLYATSGHQGMQVWICGEWLEEATREVERPSLLRCLRRSRARKVRDNQMRCRLMLKNSAFATGVRELIIYWTKNLKLSAWQAERLQSTTTMADSRLNRRADRSGGEGRAGNQFEFAKSSL